MGKNGMKGELWADRHRAQICCWMLISLSVSQFIPLQTNSFSFTVIVINIESARCNISGMFASLCRSSAFNAQPLSTFKERPAAQT